jgi:hypothetical protein
LDRDEPEETQAGSYNALDTTPAMGFRRHNGAWVSGGNGTLRYYAHRIAWNAPK